MNNIYYPEAIAKAEQFTKYVINIPEAVLMEKAALSVCHEIKARFMAPASILVLVGPGNNGGDGLAVARLLVMDGFTVDVFLSDKKGKCEAFTQELNSLKAVNLWVNEPAEILDDIKKLKKHYDVTVDALFGIGLNRSFSKKIEALVSEVNSRDSYVVAVDIPSGINAVSGEVMGTAVKADLTVSMTALKAGFYFNKAPDHTGDIVNYDLGVIFPDIPPAFYALSESDLKDLPIKRTKNAHKGTYGKTLVIAGSENIYGAAFLCAKAAFYSGAGLVKIVSHRNNKHSLESEIPEAMYAFYDNADDAGNIDLKGFDTYVLGPGLSRGPEAKVLLANLIDTVGEGNILVIDADGINLLSEYTDLFDKLSKVTKEKHINTVITPHNKELMRLFEAVGDVYFKDFCEGFYEKTGIVLLEKASRTRIYGCERFINLCGNDGMATAGSGDVLAGILGGLCYRLKDKADFARSVAFSCFLHGYAGSLAKDEKGSISMTANDMLENIPKAWEKLTDV